VAIGCFDSYNFDYIDEYPFNPSWALHEVNEATFLPR
jgi:hypothetical protein